MILGILQARASSTRLPGKVLRPILGDAMLARQIERIRRARYIDRLVVATSSEQSDDEVSLLCQRIGVDVYRGSLTDVLDRFYQTAKLHNATHVIRMTGDCPLIDPVVIDIVVCQHLFNQNDYTSNTIIRTYPDGLDVEAFHFSLLEQAWRGAIADFDREHVTPYMQREPERRRIGQVSQERDLSALRWTVDNASDFEFVARVYQALYPSNPGFSTGDVLDLLAQDPQLQMINTAI